jgi:hypothetical protein
MDGDPKGQIEVRHSTTVHDLAIHRGHRSLHQLGLDYFLIILSVKDFAEQEANLYINNKKREW